MRSSSKANSLIHCDTKIGIKTLPNTNQFKRTFKDQLIGGPLQAAIVASEKADSMMRRNTSWRKASTCLEDIAVHRAAHLASSPWIMQHRENQLSLSNNPTSHDNVNERINSDLIIYSSIFSTPPPERRKSYNLLVATAAARSVTEMSENSLTNLSKVKLFAHGQVYLCPW